VRIPAIQKKYFDLFSNEIFITVAVSGMGVHLCSTRSPSAVRSCTPRGLWTVDLKSTVISNFFRNAEKLLKEYLGADTLQPLHHLVDILVRPVLQKNVYVVAATLPEIISGSCSIAICLITSRTRIAPTPVSTGFPIFENPYWVHLQIALRAYSIASHAPTLHETLVRMKARGFNHPRGGH